jgi:hypothetical protein
VVAIPLKPEYGPTLGRLLAPRWHAATRVTRLAVLALCGALLIGAVALVLTLLNPTYAHGGPVSFSFSYRGLYRVPAEPGGYFKAQKRGAAGVLDYSFAVAPLRLAPYAGEPSGELPLYAHGYIEALRRRYAGLVLRGEGKTKVNTLPAYDVLYEAPVEGRVMYGRDILIVPERTGARDGVALAMLTRPGVSRQIEGPIEVASTGVLLRELRSFSIG